MPHISEETIQRVAEANDIVEVIESYFPLKRAGATFRALCPFHREKTPSFHVNPHRQAYKCFGCGAGGDVIRFVREYEHLEFVEAVRKLAQRAGVAIIEETRGPDEERRDSQRKRLLALHAEAAGWFHHNLMKTGAAQPARDYLKSRGIGADIAKSWLLGFAPDAWDEAADFLRGKKFTDEEIVQSGLVATKDGDSARRPRYYSRFRGRVMFPIRNDYGEVIAFSGRVLDPDAKTAKYVNSPETPLFTKGRVLYGLDKSKRALIDAKVAIVCEGQLDLISAFEAGVRNVIAPQGTAFTSDQARVLQRFVETVVLCFDSDRAGQAAVTRSLPALLEFGLDVRVARLPEGEDPDSLIRTRGPDAFRQVVETAQNFFDHALTVYQEHGLLADPAGNAAAARRLAAHVALIRDKALQETTARRICSRLGISQAAFSAHLARKPAARSADPDAAPPPPVLELNHGVAQLCRLALLNADARHWMREQEPLPTSADLAGLALLQKILLTDLELERPAALAAFCTGLDTAESNTIAGLDLSRPPADPLRTAQDLWNGFAAQAIRRRIEENRSRQGDRSLAFREQIRLQLALIQGRHESARTRLAQPDDNLTLSQKAALEEEAENLGKQILDLENRLREA